VFRVLPLLVALAVGACSRTPAEAHPDQEPDQAAAVKPVPAELPGVLARVNGEDISRSEFEEAVRSIESRAGMPVPTEERDRFFRSLLDQLIGHKLLVQETVARSITVTDAELDAYVARIRSQFPSDEVFQQVLAQQQLTVDLLRTEARQDMAIAKMVEVEVESKAAVTQEQLDAFYRDNPDQFQEEARVRASHILIEVPADADEAAKARARERAEGVLRDLRAGQDFAALARQHSQDQGSASEGGDLGYFAEGEMVGPFNDAVFALDTGATSDLVETNFGFHIIRVTDKQPARTIPLAEVRPQLEEFLEERNRQQETEAFVDGLRSKGTVEIFI
jgi:peptidyl-prolyl cis-trans isomerase C